MNIRRKLATTLRRVAHKLHPESLASLDVTWEPNKPPHVDIQYRHGGRVRGYVASGDNITVHQSPDGWPDQSAGPYAKPA